MNSIVRSGYTLVEILIAISILGLLFAFGFVNFRDFSRRQEVISAGRSIRADLRLTQELALSGNKPTWCTGVLNGFGFTVSANGYSIQAVCSSGTPAVYKTGTFPANISTSTYPSPNPIIFKVLGQGTNLTADATLTLIQTGTGNTEVITVTSGGEIK